MYSYIYWQDFDIYFVNHWITIIIIKKTWVWLYCWQSCLLSSSSGVVQLVDRTVQAVNGSNLGKCTFIPGDEQNSQFFWNIPLHQRVWTSWIFPPASCTSKATCQIFLCFCPSIVYLWIPGACFSRKSTPPGTFLWPSTRTCGSGSRSISHSSSPANCWLRRMMSPAVQTCSMSPTGTMA